MQRKTSRGRLVCQECRTVDKDGLGWKAYIASELEVLVYCPFCAWREFGGASPEREHYLPDSFDPE